MLHTSIASAFVTRPLRFVMLLGLPLLTLVACAPPPGDVAQQRSALATPAQSTWSAQIPLSLVPSSSANLPSGKVMLWASNSPLSFGGSGQTYSTIFDPATNTASDVLVTQTGHDMFCTGTSNLPDGKLLINGGDDSAKTSLYDPATNTWTTGAQMNIPRGYDANTVLEDGSVFTLGGSWSGGQGGKNGEVWTAAGGWRRLPGVPVGPALAPDPNGVYRGDNHMWLLSAPNGQVLHAGPSASMNWIDPQGGGAIVSAGTRNDDAYSMCGDAVLYDVGKILKVGGAPGYENVTANAGAYAIDINDEISVRKLTSATYARTFANGVALPNGQVLIVGGQTIAHPFSDDNSILKPELWDPATETFTMLPPIAVGRNYHSIALLLPDARVLSGGGGLCGAGCSANHPDLQILTPYYLLNADGTPATRPVITAAPATATHGTTIAVSTDSAVTAFSLMRLASNTHAVNNDQRRVPLTFTDQGANHYALQIPDNAGVVLHGYYMLFAMNAAGVPSVAATMRITGDGAPSLRNPGTQNVTAGGAVNLQLAPVVQAGTTYSAGNLPAGVAIDATSGQLTGAPTTPGRYVSLLKGQNALASTSTKVLWVVTPAPAGVTYAKLEALSEINGNPWASIAEFNLIDGNGDTLSRTGWTATGDTEETAAENGVAMNAIDGDPTTVWTTQRTAWVEQYPHSLTVKLPSPAFLSGFRYLPRAGGGAGTIAGWRFYTSQDGVTWTLVSQGNFNDFADVAAEKSIYFVSAAKNRAATQSSTYNNRDASTAIDGVTSGAGEALVTHTQSEANAWWQVDLGSQQMVESVRLWTRTDCCSDRTTNFYVFVSKTDLTGRPYADILGDTSIARVHVPGTFPLQLLLAVKAQGRYVRVQLAGTNILSLAEVEVFARVPGNRPPQLAAIANPTTAVGQAGSVALSATDADGDAITFTSGTLPAGIMLDGATGVLSGTTTLAGTYPVTVQAHDALGGVALGSFTWTVTATPIVLTANPSPAATAGSPTTMSVSGGGAGTTYTWDFGDGSAPVVTTDPNATHTYATPGTYTVTVTANGSGGSVGVLSFTKAVAGVTGAPHPAMSSAGLVVEPRAGGERIWVVNQDQDSVSVFSSTTHARLAEITVGIGPRTLAIAPDGRVWVANKKSASISIIDTNSLALVATLPMTAASAPYGIVFAPDGTRAYVTLEATGHLVSLASNDGHELGRVPLGLNVRHLAVEASGDHVLVSRFITPPQPGESTATVTTQVAGANVGGEVLLVKASDLHVEKTVMLRHGDKVDSTVQGRGVPNYLGAPVIAPDGKSAWIPSKQDNIQRGTLRDGTNLDFQNSVRAISSRIDLVTQAEDYSARIDHDNSGRASAAAFHPTGTFLFVALSTSRHVAVVDPVSHDELFRVDAGRAPDAVAVSGDGLTLYVGNFMDRSVGVYDLQPLVTMGAQILPLLATLAAVPSDKLSAQVLRGKQLFYDARDGRLARDAYLACAGCHDDGDSDGRTWDFTGLGEGLRNTISLRGHGSEKGPLHASQNFDEVQDFENQIRFFAQGTGLMSDSDFFSGTHSQPLGDSKKGLSADLDALAAYLSSLTVAPDSPHRGANGLLTADATVGRVVYGAACATCHGGSGFTDSELGAAHDIGTIKPASGRRASGPLVGLDSPSLLGAWATAPYLHDGSAATIEDAIMAHHDLALTPIQMTQVSSFVRQLSDRDAQVVPNAGGLRGRYYANASFAGNMVAERVEPVSFDWGMTSPAAGQPVDGFSVRWSGAISPPVTGEYRLRVVSHGHTRVLLDGVQVLEQRPARVLFAATSEPILLLTGMRHRIVVEYRDAPGAASVSLLWSDEANPGWSVIPAAAFSPDAPVAGTSLALGRTATASTEALGGVASRAVDGNTNGAWAAGSVTHTAYEKNPWWQVDLANSHRIDSITVHNRTDCCWNRLANFTVTVSDRDLTGMRPQQLLFDRSVWRYKVVVPVGAKLTIPVSRRGRFVRVQVDGSGYLSLAEVEVHGS